MDTPADILTLLSVHPPFSGFSALEQQALADEMTLVSYPARYLVLAQGSTDPTNVYLVVSGKLRVAEASTFSEFRTVEQGSFIGQYSILREGPLPFQVESLSDCTLACLPVHLFTRLCLKHPRVAAFFNSELDASSRLEVAAGDNSGTRFLFGTRLSDLVHRSPPRCDVALSVRQAASVMAESNCGYVVVMREALPAGLVTDADLRAHVAAGSPDAPLKTVMGTASASLTDRHSVFDAMLLMLDRKITHIVVNRSSGGQMLGVIAANDVARAQGYSPVLLIEQILRADTIGQLAELRLEANGQLLQLYQRGVHARDLIGINTLVNDRLTERVLSLAEIMAAGQYPPVRCRWAWLSLGSEGRGEMCLHTDQDNALVFDVVDELEAGAQQWLAHWATMANQSLHTIGLTSCKAGIMAGCDDWRHRPSQWRHQFQQWMISSRADDIIRLSAACDMRAVQGDTDLEKQLKADLQTTVQDNPRFIKHMAQAVLANPSPLSLFTRRIRTTRTDEGRVINIKQRGLQPLTDFARILTLQAGYLESSNTLDRLAFLESEQPALRETVGNVQEAWRHLIDIRLGLHFQRMSNGQSPSDMLAVDQLGRTRREMLKAAFSCIQSVQAVLAQRFGLQIRW